MSFIIDVRFSFVSVSCNTQKEILLLRKEVKHLDSKIYAFQGFWFIQVLYQDNSDLLSIFNKVFDLFKADKEFIFTGSNLCYAEKILPNKLKEWVSNNHKEDFRDIFIKQIPKLMEGFKKNIFYVKEPISPDQFTQFQKIQEIVSKKYFVEFDLKESFFFLDLRKKCSLSIINSFPIRETLQETKNGEFSFITLKRVLDSCKGKDKLSKIEGILDKGDNYNIDIRVRDIYGEFCKFLPVDVLASSFGKATSDSSTEDALKSFIFVLIINISNLVSVMVC